MTELTDSMKPWILKVGSILFRYKRVPRVEGRLHFGEEVKFGVAVGLRVRKDLGLVGVCLSVSAMVVGYRPVCSLSHLMRVACRFHITPA